MKKILILALAVIMLFAITACVDEKSDILKSRNNSADITDVTDDITDPDDYYTEPEDYYTEPYTESATNGSGKVLLGITGYDVTQEMQEDYSLPQGFLITEVDPYGPCAYVDIRPNDVLVGFDGVGVANGEYLMGLLKYYSPGDKVDLVVYRTENDTYFTYTVTLMSQ